MIGLLVGLLFIKLYGYYAPLTNDDDDAIQETAQYSIFLTLLAALVLKTDSIALKPIADGFIILMCFVTPFVTMYFLLMDVKDFLAGEMVIEAADDEKEEKEKSEQEADAKAIVAVHPPQERVEFDSGGAERDIELGGGGGNSGGGGGGDAIVRANFRVDTAVSAVRPDIMHAGIDGIRTGMGTVCASSSI